MATLCPGQPLAEGGEDRSVCPVHARSRVGAAQHGDLVAQHEELDALGRRRADRQQDQPEHLPEDQVQQPQRHDWIMPTQRSSLVSDPARVLEPHTRRERIAIRTFRHPPTWDEAGDMTGHLVYALWINQPRGPAHDTRHGLSLPTHERVGSPIRGLPI
jgi:hypothetical protein